MPSRKKTPGTPAIAGLPPHLEGILRRARSGALPALPGIPDANAYVIGWAVGYLLGDREHVMGRLEDVHEQLAPAPKPGKSKHATKKQEPCRAPGGAAGPGGDTTQPSRKPGVQYDISDAAEPKTCSCGREIFFVHTETGIMPVTAEGFSHFEDCPDREQYSKKGRTTAFKKTTPPKPAMPGLFS